MKRLIAVRHAKAADAGHGQKDFDRSLADRGKKDAKDMGSKLYGEGIRIDLFVSSPAKRTRQTCKAFLEEYGRSKEEMAAADELYNAPYRVYYDVTEALPATAETVAVFGHNPGITHFVSTLCDDVKVDDMPTCGVFCVEADISDWKDFGDAEKKFIFFDYPKMQL